MKLPRPKRPKTVIPTASVADIAFLLILFFMVCSVIRTEKGIRIELPEAKTTQRIRKRKWVASVWIDRKGRITVDDALVKLSQIPIIFKSKLLENPSLIVLINADKNAKYKYVNDVNDKLREANAYRVVFAAKFKRTGG